MNIFRPDHAAYDVTAAWFEQTASSRSSARRDEFYSALDSRSASSSATPQGGARKVEEADDEEQARASRDAESRTRSSAHAESAANTESLADATNQEARDGRIECCFPFQDAYRRNADGQAVDERRAEPGDRAADVISDSQAQTKSALLPRSGERADSNAKQAAGTENHATEPTTQQVHDRHVAPGAGSKAAKTRGDQSQDASSSEAEKIDVGAARLTGEAADANSVATKLDTAEAPANSESLRSEEVAGESTERIEAVAASVAATTEQVPKQSNPSAIETVAGIRDPKVSADQAEQPGGTGEDSRHERGRRASRQVNDDAPILTGERRRAGKGDADGRAGWQGSLTSTARERVMSASAETTTPAAEMNLGNSATTPSLMSATVADGGLRSGLSAELTGNVSSSAGASSSASSASPTSLGASVANVDGGASSSESAVATRQREASVTNEMRLNQADQRRLMQRVSSAFRTIGAGEGEIRLRLSPPHLGSLRLEVRVKDQTLHARLQTESEAARHVLTENLSVLRDRLADQGIVIESFDIDVAEDGFEQSSGNSHEAGQEQERQLHESASPTRPGQPGTGEQAANELELVADIDARGHLNVVI